MQVRVPRNGIRQLHDLLPQAHTAESALQPATGRRGPVSGEPELPARRLQPESGVRASVRVLRQKRLLLPEVRRRGALQFHVHVPSLREED